MIFRRGNAATQAVLAKQRSEAERYLDELLARLDGPLTDEMHAFGWDNDLQRGLLEWCTELRGKLRRGETLTHSDLASGMVRWLDVAGVTDGELVKLAARVSNSLRCLVDGHSPSESFPQKRRRRRNENEQLSNLDKLVKGLTTQHPEDD